MSQVQTISGPVDSGALGWTLSHEHLTSGMGGVERIPGLYNEDEVFRRCMDALKRAYDAGIRTIVDCTPLDLGRQPALFERLAEASPIQIVGATGVYRWVPLTYYSWTADTLAEQFLRDIQDGMDGTSPVRAGIIKLAWDLEYRIEDGGERSPRAQLEKAARAAARAARAAGVPITCHTRAADRHGDRLLDIFEEEGLDLRAVTIGHSNDSRDMDYLLGMLKRGATVGLDRYVASDNDEMTRRAGVALELIRAGYAEQVCLGHDAAACSMNAGPPTGGPRVENDACWLPVPEFQVPWLREQGVSDADIEAVMSGSVRATFDAARAMTG
jgi:phosphotriesterase-related protein